MLCDVTLCRLSSVCRRFRVSQYLQRSRDRESKRKSRIVYPLYDEGKTHLRSTGRHHMNDTVWRQTTPAASMRVLWEPKISQSRHCFRVTLSFLCVYMRVNWPTWVCDWQTNLNMHIFLAVRFHVGIHSSYWIGVKLRFFFIVAPCILTTLMFLLPTNALLYYTYKMLKYTVKTSHYMLLHVSVHLDHHQGAYAELC